MLTYVLLVLVLLLISSHYVIYNRYQKRGLTKAELDRKLLARLNSESEAYDQKTGRTISQK